MAIPLKQIPFKSVVDELILVAPAVQLADIRAHSLARMLGSQLSHSLEVNLTSSRAHIQQSLAKVPSWMSFKILRMAFLVSSVMIFGPVM